MGAGTRGVGASAQTARKGARDSSEPFGEPARHTRVSCAVRRQPDSVGEYALADGHAVRAVAADVKTLVVQLIDAAGEPWAIANVVRIKAVPRTEQPL